MQKLRRALMMGALALLCASVNANAATVPVGFLDRQIASGITSPTALTALPDGRVLVFQQNGVIRMIKGDVMLGTNFWGVPNVDSSNERGCLGITPDPDFATNRFVYVYCTILNSTGAANQVIRVTEANDVMVPGSERVIFALPNVPAATKWHMGGALRFGTDGKLYVAVGNHEDNPTNPSNAQSLANPFGKILRINKDGTIPSDNPYVGTAGAYTAIWNRGYRNPFAFDIQPGTGRMLVGDVGQGTWEEVNDSLRGANYGWPFFEGTGQLIAPPAGFAHTPPFYAYSHGAGGCAITGVAFYNPVTAQFPVGYVGKLLYQDFCQGTISTLDPANKAVAGFVSGISFPTNMTVTRDGSVYYMARNQQTGSPTPGGGTVSKITYTASQVPRCTLHPANQTVVVGGSVTFQAASDGATSAQWQRNNVNIAGATATTYTRTNVQTADNGASFQMVVTNSFGSAICGPATLTVVNHQFPVARINTPADGAMFAAGDVISYSGTGTDNEDGNLPASSLTWQVNMHHDSHSHPAVAAHTGSGGSFTIGTTDVSEPNIWYRIFLTVRDSGGLTNTTFRDVYPGTLLSTLTPVGTPLNGWGPIEKDKSNGEAGAGDGATIRLAGVPYAKGWGVHAPSEMVFDITGCTGEFISHAGVDDEVGDAGSAVFQVYLDNVLAHDTGVSTGTELPKYIRVGINGKRQLKLVATDAGDGNAFDHVDWAGARVTGCPRPNGNIINTLSVRDTANAVDWSIRSNLQVNDLTYGDRTFTFTGVPASVAGSVWIRPANDSKAYTGNPLATFNVSAAADVYLSLDDRQARPSWVDATWTDTLENMSVRESASVTRPFSLYRKRFAAGQVSLGPWGNSANSMYQIIVKAAVNGTYPAWQEGQTYTVGTRVTYQGINYECLQTHTACVGCGWNPPATPTLWRAL